MANRGQVPRGEEQSKSIHTRYARELILQMVVLCLFVSFYGNVWSIIQIQYKFHPIIEVTIEISTQLGIGFYAFYQIPRTAQLCYEDWKD